MEGLIIALLIGLVTTFMNRKEGKKETPAKPFMPQKEPTVETTQMQRAKKSSRPKLEVKSLEDFTREVMSQLSTKEATKKQEVVEAVQAVPEKLAERVARPTLRQPIEERVKERQQASRVDVKASANFQVPMNRQAMRQAIIMAEVLGKPKAKQR